MTENIQQLDLAQIQSQTRRHFLGWGAGGLGAFFLNSAMAAPSGENAPLNFTRNPATPLSVLPPQFAPKVKRVIYLHMGGAPSQLELFDYKPVLAKFHGNDCPESFIKGKRLAFIQGIPKLLGPMFPFHRAGKSGTWISDRLPHLEKAIDDLCVIKSMFTEAINHDPAVTFIQTGSQLPGRPSIGAWCRRSLRAT